jgi:hypothetical protein
MDSPQLSTEVRIMFKRLIKNITLTIFLVIVTFIQSCAQVEHTKKPKELYSIVSTGNAIILFRIKPIIEGNRSYTGPYYTIFGINIQSARGGQIAKVISPLSPKPPEEVRGWLYITLPPGAYSMNLIVNPLIFRDELFPSFTVDIPKGQPMVYIGSFKVHCSIARKFDIFTLGIWEWISTCQSPVDMMDESTEALEISKTYFNQYGLPAISLAQRK